VTPLAASELERLAARCLFPGFAGLEPPDWIRPWLDAGLGGVVLFARNVRDGEQLARLTSALHAERSELLVTIDEEGGDVTRLEADRGSSYPGNRALGVVDDPGLTEQVASALAGDLARVGVDLDLAPVADVAVRPENPIVGVRSFGSDPQLVARHVAAFVRGMQRMGVAACAKHFPGHGDTGGDSHVGLPTVAKTRAALDAEDLVPFRAAIGAGVRSIMTAHLQVPALDGAPATLSPAVLDGLLRAELGFDGMVITDALDMGAVSATVGAEEGAVRALAAGADALCLGHDLRPEGPRAGIVEAVRQGRLSEERLAEAGARVDATAHWASRASAAAAADSSVGLVAARRALRAGGTVELDRPPLVVELQPEPSIAAGPAGHGLGVLLPGAEVVRLPEPRPVSVPAGRQLVLVLLDAHRHPWQRELAEALLAAAPDAVVVESGLPLWRPAGGAGYLETQGAGRVNLQAAAERLLARLGGLSDS
jgi:beta-N-acetylhexosaminidase